jgi:2-desacetyl-2-hydroxyethyl bacteriochlorophyllide A dehydrogenase
MQARRLVFPDRNKCEVETFELADSPGAGQVLVQNRVTLVSAGTELAMFTRSHRGFDEPDFGYAKYPFRPGYAAVGEVLQVGEGVADIREGDRVFHAGHHATHALTGGARKLPGDLSDERAAFQALTSISMSAPRLAPVRLGENVVVVGMGLVGNLCAQLCKLAGAAVVAGADLSAARLAKALDCGIDRAFNLGEKPLAEWAAELGPAGAELVIEAVGIPPTIDACMKAVADNGRVVLLGSPRLNMEFDPYFDIHRKAMRIIGAHGRGVDAATRERDVPFICSLLASGRVRVDSLVTHQMPFAEGLAAFEGLRDRKDEYLGVLLRYPG